MLKKTLSISLVVLLIAGVVGAFSIAQEKVTLTLIHPWAGAEEELFKPVVAAAEEALGIEIETKIIRSEDLITLLPTQWAAGTAPGDVIFLTVPPLIRKGAAEGHILEVTDVIDPAEFVLGTVDLVTVDGKIYGAPYTSKVKPGFWYRKSFFEEHGLAEPTNWAELEALLEELKGIEGLKAPIASGDGVGWPLSDTAEHFLVAFGGPELHRELAGCVCFPKWWSIIKAIFNDVLAPWIAAGYFSEPIEWTTALEMWWRGDFALYFMGSWITGMVDDPEDLGLFPIPGTMGVARCIDFLFVSAYTEHPKEAKALLKWLATEGQKIQVTTGGHIATYIPVPLDLYPPVDRMVAEKVAPMVSLFDLDDAIGGEFQTTFWDQLKLLWVEPERVDEVVDVIHEAYDRACGCGS